MTEENTTEESTTEENTITEDKTEDSTPTESGDNGGGKNNNTLLIVLIVLMQRPKQEGLGAAFGGGMTDQMFGAQTTDVLQKGTVWLTVMFWIGQSRITIIFISSILRI